MRIHEVLRTAVAASAAGALAVATAGAGVGSVPFETPGPTDAAPAIPVPLAAPAVTDNNVIPEVRLPGERLIDGWYWVGAAKVSIYPRPEAYGGTWERDPKRCRALGGGLANGDASHLAVAGSPWPENPSCIYAGGYGIGPMNPLVDFDRTYGLWVRSVAISDGAQPLFLTVLDGEGWFWDYATKCADCGFRQIATRLAEQFGTDPAAFVFHTTHSHTAPDFIGGWGFVPDWYMRQVTDAVYQSVRAAVASMRRARLEVGEVLARSYNRQRRDTYHAPEEPGLVWLRAYIPADKRRGPKSGATTIATVGVYAAHPTTVDVSRGVAHPDWPGVFAAALERRFGGVGLHFMSGLGNMSPAGGTEMGAQLAELVPDVGGGRSLDVTRVRVAQVAWDQPVTNAPLSALGVPGFFDRKFQPVPASLRTGSNPDASPCLSASPVSVRTVAGAAEVGGTLYVTAGPGELFSNSTNTIKEAAAAADPPRLALAIAQANDALGYLPESFEQAQNPASSQGAGFVTSGPAHIEYEDAYMIDRCFGDKVLQTILNLLDGFR